MKKPNRCALITCLGAFSTLSIVTGGTAQSVSPTRDQLQTRLNELRASIAGLDKRLPWQDAAIFAKGAEWALRYDKELGSTDLALLQKALDRGFGRVQELQAKKHPWTQIRGRLTRGYVSFIDGSIQPYGLVVPKGYDPTKAMRLDVVLHGSVRPIGMSELRFMMPFDEGDGGGTAPDRNYIELHPLGRVENCYRWAGETDVFEAIEDVCRNYNIDRDRVVLRGMSMGASGTWHLGLKYPDRFVALGPYCGYVDTHRFSETPGMNFVRVGPLPTVQEDSLHMLDSVDYAANAGVVPAIAAMGEKDPFFQAHVIMGEAFKREGIPFTNLIAPGTAHVQDPTTWAEQMQQIGQHAAKGIDHQPKRIRFVTWTLKYSGCHWVQILRLNRHYARAEIEAEEIADRTIRVKPNENVAQFCLSNFPQRVEIGGKTVEISYPRNRVGPPVFARIRGNWAHIGFRDRGNREGKRPGVQGPIDDAFTTRFLCVRGTGTPWNPSVDAWAKANLARFEYEWGRYFRGDLKVKDDKDVTSEDRQNYNLILFGDPGSNSLIRDSISKFPVRWTRQSLSVGKDKYTPNDHAPAFIQPSPWGRDRYVVVNSGHTFHEAELNRLNYLLFPRLGDWAVFKIGEADPVVSDMALNEEVVKAGWFNERWVF